MASIRMNDDVEERFKLSNRVDIITDSQFLQIKKKYSNFLKIFMTNI